MFSLHGSLTRSQCSSHLAAHLLNIRYCVSNFVSESDLFPSPSWLWATFLLQRDIKSYYTFPKMPKLQRSCMSQPDRVLMRGGHGKIIRQRCEVEALDMQLHGQRKPPRLLDRKWWCDKDNDLYMAPRIAIPRAKSWSLTFS